MNATAILGVLLLIVTLCARVIGTQAVNVLGDPILAPWFIFALCVSVAVYFAAVRTVLRSRMPPALWMVLGVAVLLRAMALFTPPFMSSDIYRYVWDGMVQIGGINPYLYLPSDAALQSLRDSAIFPHINRADYAPTIYAPAAQILFAAVAFVQPSVLALKCAILGCEALTLLCLLRLLEFCGLPRVHSLMYAWNPLVVWEFVANGHIDAAAVALIAVALLLRARSRDGWAGMALAGAVMVKFLPLALGPALWRRAGAVRLVIGGIAALVLLYGVYAMWGDAGWKVLGFLEGYSKEEGLDSGRGLWPLAWLSLLAPLPAWFAKFYLALALAALAVLGLRVMTRLRSSDDIAAVCGDAALLAGGLLFVLSPHYAWYYGWMALFASIRPSRAAIWLGCAPLMLYAVPSDQQATGVGLIFLLTLLLAWRDLRSLLPSSVPAQGTL